MISAADEQFLRLQNALLELSELSPPELSPNELDAELFLGDFERIFDGDEEAYNQAKRKKQNLLDSGRKAMEESGYSFLIRDVTETKTEFGQVWQKTKEIVSEYLNIDTDIDYIDSIYASNDLDNVRYHAYGPGLNWEESIVGLELRYFPMGLLEVKSTSYGVLGEESLTQKWYVGPHEWGEGYPLDRHHIRGYVNLLMRTQKLMSNHIEKHGCVDDDYPWIGRY